jgi:hypothetical protein
LTAFSKKVLNTANPFPADIDPLRENMKGKLALLQLRLTQNAPNTPYGNGRLDAFAHIFDARPCAGFQHSGK